PLCDESIRFLQRRWDLPVPRRCRVYIMTSAWQFVFHSATWPRRVLYAITLPLWYRNLQKTWRLAAGWTLPYRSGPVVGVKPQRIWLNCEESAGRRIFNPEVDDKIRLRVVVCHEMTHAVTAHLGLPWWLNEGLAMITEEGFLGTQTVRADTL